MDEIKLSQKFSVISPKEPKVYPIFEYDWMRIKKLLRQIIPSRKIYSILGSIFLGICGSSIFSIISFISVDKLPAWILPTNISICISSLILGIVLLIFDNHQKKMVTISSNSILEEMEDIEKKYDIENTDTSPNRTVNASPPVGGSGYKKHQSA